MKTLNELRNLLEDSRNFTKIHSMNSNDISKIYSSAIAYEPCKTISNLDILFDNYKSPYRENKSYLELAKSGHFDNQNKITIDSILYSTKYLEYEMYSMVPELIEYTANSEDGEIIEIESENPDIQTDDSDDSGDGDDDDPSHPLALDKQNKARKIIRKYYYKSVAELPSKIILLLISSFIFKFNPFFEIVQAITAVENESLFYMFVKLILKYIFNNI